MAILERGTEGNTLPTDQLGRVDHQHVGIARPVVEGAPAALDQQGVADLQRGLGGPAVAPLTLHAEDQQVTAGDHQPGAHGLPDQPGPGWDHDLGHSPVLVHQRGGRGLPVVDRLDAQLLVRRVLLDVGGVARHRQPVTFAEHAVGDRAARTRRRRR